MECLYCKKCITNTGSLKAHEKYCHLNPNKKVRISNFINYNNKLKNGEIVKKYSNQYDKATFLGEKITMSESTKNKLSNAKIGKLWNKEQKILHSIKMKNVVKSNPESYTKNNVVGRVKNIEYKGVKLKGSWELLFAQWLDKNSIEWKHEAKAFEYEWNGSRLYFPDFYLPQLDLYVEVKGYETERDRQKWKVVPNLLVIKKKEIEQIKRGIFTLAHIGSRS